jgi:hypothetical protein
MHAIHGIFTQHPEAFDVQRGAHIMHPDPFGTLSPCWRLDHALSG